EVVLGVKDSSGVWANAEALLSIGSDLAILVGDERHLAAAVRLGGEGAISGLANICPQALHKTIEEGRDDPRVLELVKMVVAEPVLPAIKALVAHRTRDPAWLAMRPPLTALGAADAARIGLGFEAIFAREAVA